MKRDMDLVRSILLLVEANPSPEDPITPFEVSGFDEVTVYHHVQLLHEAGLLTAMERNAIGLYEWWSIALTWSGHDFLDSVRNPETWAKTKKGALAAGGFTLDLLKDLEGPHQKADRGSHRCQTLAWPSPASTPLP